MSDLAPDTSELRSVEGSQDTPLVAPPSQSPVAPQTGNSLAVARMVLGITSILFCWWGVFTLAQVVLATTFSAVGIHNANRRAAHKGVATAGLVCGISGAVVYVIIGTSRWEPAS